MNLHRLHISQDPFFTSSPYEPELPAVQHLKDIDLVDPELYHRGDPHAAWRLLRKEAPVFWHEKGTKGTDGKGFWVLTRYNDSGFVYRDSTLFTSESGPFVDLGLYDAPHRILPSLDGKEHQQRRNLVIRFFNPGALERYTESIRATVNRLFDAVADRGDCDFSKDIAEKLPITATCNLIGISDAEAQSLADMILQIESNTGDSLKRFNDAVQQFFKSVTEERRDSPVQETIVDAVARAQIDGQPISETDMLHLLWVLFLGGIDSTVHAATGGLLALFHHPEQLQIMRETPGIMKTALEEIVRWTATSHANKRQVTQDIEIHGTRIKKGDFITVWSPSANRDEEAYPDPFRFDVRRNITRPVATFGMGGKHTCIGQYFARLELRVLLEELFRRFPGVEQTAPMERSPAYTMQISPITSLPVRLKQ